MKLVYITKRKAFTLIELVVVMVIVGVIAAVTLIKWPGSSLMLEQQADRLKHDIRYAQNLSMTQGERYAFIKTASNTYQIQNTAGSVLIETITLGSGITFSSLINLPNNLVAFDSKGTPYTDAGSPGTALATTASIILTQNGQTQTITITPETGYVS